MRVEHKRIGGRRQADIQASLGGIALRGLLLLFAFGANWEAIAATDHHILVDLKVLREAHPAIPDKVRAIRRFHDEKVSVLLGQLVHLKDEDLHELFSVSHVAAQFASVGDYANREVYAGDMERVLAELQRRGVARPDEVEAYYDYLLIRRDFAGMSAIKQHFGSAGLWDYSAFSDAGKVDASRPAGYVARGESQLRLTAVSLPDDGRYVVIVIGCHFAFDAAKALAADKRLADVLAGERVFWVFDESQLDKDAVGRWDTSFPGFRSMIVYDNAAWRGVDFTSTPTFSYFDGGRLVHVETGWDGEAGVLDVTRSLERIGLLAPQHH